MMLSTDLLAELETLPDALARQAWGQQAVGSAALAEALCDQVKNLAQTDLPRALSLGAALTDALALCSPAIRAFSLWAYAVALRASARYDEALAFFRQAGTTFEMGGEPLMAARTVLGEVATLGYLERYAEAHKRGAKAHAWFQAYNAVSDIAKLELNLAGVWMRQEQPKLARESYLRARAAINPADEPVLAAMIDGNLACTYLALDDFRAARTFFERARAAFSAQGLMRRVAQMDVSLSDIELWQGHYQRADVIIEGLRPVLSKQGLVREGALVDLHQSSGRLALNLLDEALSLAERAASAFEELGLSKEQGRALINKALALGRLERFEEAETALQQARGLLKSGNRSLALGLVESYTADMALRRGQPEVALTAAEQAVAVFEARNLSLRAAQATIMRGEALAALGQDEQAQAAFKQALSALEIVGLPWMRYRAYLGLGRLHVRVGDRPLAVAAWQAAVHDVESVHANLGLEEYKIGYFGDKQAVYEELVALCLDEANSSTASSEALVQAFNYVERAKSRSLLDRLLAQDSAALESDGASAAEPRLPAISALSDDMAPAAMNARIAELRAELNWYYNRLNASEFEAGERFVEVNEDLQGALLDREWELQRLHRRLALVRNPHSRGSALDALLPPAALQGLLPGGTLMLEFYCLGDEIVAFTIDRQHFQIHRRLASLKDVQGALQRLQFQLNKFRLGAGYAQRHAALLMQTTTATMQQLYQALLGPLVGWLERAERLVIVPHGPLHTLPFHALVGPDGPLLQSQEVSYAPSATIFARCLERRPQPGANVLLMGLSDERIPRVRDEVTAIAAHWPGASVYLDEQVTIGRLREEAGRHRIIHLATHGLFRSDNPSFSALKLADGWLSLPEIATLPLSNVELVTLSACETGVSHVAAGDELISLSRAFFAAGPTSLVVSLWTVDDHAAATLMEQFYLNLRAGQSKSAALRQAQLVIREQYPHPYFWAPFVLLGQPA
jgi:CHAT domain-containing protein/tetratricopeptide (TPR) repeat protein